MLFTAPGERVNRPTFGSGLLQLVFDPNSEEVATAVQLHRPGLPAAVARDVIQVEGVAVRGEEGTLEVTVQYIVRRTQERQTATFQDPL